MSTIIDSFRKYGLDFLIPSDADQYDELLCQDFCDDYNFGYDNDYDDAYSNYGYNELSNHMRDDYEKDVFELAEEEDFEDDGHDGYIPETPRSLQSLKDRFDLSYVSDVDFLNMEAGELFGITNAQLKFIDIDILQNIGVPLFLDTFKRKDVVENIPDVEQRIRYSLVVGLARADQIFLPNDICTAEDKRNLFFYIKKIAIGKEIETSCNRLRLYKDYLLFYKDALAMNEERAENKEPVFSYSLFPKVSHLKDLHDKAMRDHMEMDTRRGEARRKQLDENIKKRCKSLEYRQFLKKGEKYSVLPVDGYDSLVKEGKDLDHCVATYADALANGKTNIYFLRRNEKPDASFYTAEVEYQSETKKYALTQCYGYGNTTEKPESFKKFIVDWTKEKRIKISCAI